MLKQVQHDEAARQFPTPFPPFHRLRPIVSKRTFAWHGICPRGAVLQLKCLVPSPDRTSPTIWKPPPESRPQAASSGVKSRLWLIAARTVFSRNGLEIRKVGRSEESRVGKECGRTCSSRWWPYT